jgi:cytidine deaminase
VDVANAHAEREAYKAPAQSQFRVAALLRFRRADSTEGTIQAVNEEPHDGNIRGAICAERAAMCRFQSEEQDSGANVLRVVVVTDAPPPIYPGPLCREFLTATCSPDVEVVASGTKDPVAFVNSPLRDLLPLPSVYRRKDQPAMKAAGEAFSGKVRAPSDASSAKAYTAAFERAKKQTQQLSVFPLVFAGAVSFEDGRVYCTHELKGIEYGCTVDAVSLLIPELVRVREEGLPPAVSIVQVDNFGVAHAPFAAARSLLVEHGFGAVRLCAHADDGEWAAAMSAKDSLPNADFTEIF